MVSKRGFVACLGLLLALTTAPASAQEYQLSPEQFFSWFCEHGETFSAARTPYVAREMAMEWPESPNPNLSVSANDQKLENGLLYLGQMRWGADARMSLRLDAGTKKIFSSRLASNWRPSDYQILVGGDERKGIKVTENFLEVFSNALGVPCEEVGDDYEGYHQECVTGGGPRMLYESSVPETPTVRSEGYVQAVGSGDLAAFGIVWSRTENPVELACETNRHFWDNEAADRRQAERNKRMAGLPSRDTPEGMQDDGDGKLSPEELETWFCKYAAAFQSSSTNKDLVLEMINDFPFPENEDKPEEPFVLPEHESVESLALVLDYGRLTLQRFADDWQDGGRSTAGDPKTTSYSIGAKHMPFTDDFVEQ